MYLIDRDQPKQNRILIVVFGALTLPLHCLLNDWSTTHCTCTTRICMPAAICLLHSTVSQSPCILLTTGILLAARAMQGTAKGLWKKRWEFPLVPRAHNALQLTWDPVQMRNPLSIFGWQNRPNQAIKLWSYVAYIYPSDSPSDTKAGLCSCLSRHEIIQWWLRNVR